MMCEQTQLLLEAFADNDLGWGTARRVRRHLSGCPECAAELAEVRRLDARVRVWRDVPGTAHLQSRVAAALASARPMSVPRRPVLVRRTAVGLAGLAAALVAFFWIVPGQPGRPTVAFADVENAMQQVQTLSWVATAPVPSFLADQHGKVQVKYHVATQRTWIRRRPAAIATLSLDDGTCDLVDERGDFTQNRGSNYQERGLGKSTEEDIAKRVERKIRSMTQPPTDANPQRSSGTLITGYVSGRETSSSFHSTSTPVQERPATLDGQIQTLFTRHTELTIAAYPAPFNVVHIKQSVWADPATHRVTQVEIENSGGMLGPNVRTVIVYNHFLYNQPPPPGTFDWSPPPGAIVARH